MNEQQVLAVGAEARLALGERTMQNFDIEAVLHDFRALARRNLVLAQQLAGRGLPGSQRPSVAPGMQALTVEVECHRADAAVAAVTRQAFELDARLQVPEPDGIVQ